MKIDCLSLIRCLAMALINFQLIALAHAPAAPKEPSRRSAAVGLQTWPTETAMRRDRAEVERSFALEVLPVPRPGHDLCGAT
ncbi:hypothetical protein M2232_004536 [Bradyrhizobium japonicum]|nr:hypothetical protein [Bradyrhizobium japonicum]MCS3960119.1 hypothetical protein [Bradyrhizobium japonicum]MCS4001872.1 hypothetical protein [Bradyrhizobium japonicum]MCW2221004.1 hypothetical protein [Bradyrhizobium japonicum]MCW2345616.1 hypothetical protein [Bradyrhizobium japonicum]